MPAPTIEGPDGTVLQASYTIALPTFYSGGSSNDNSEMAVYLKNGEIAYIAFEDPWGIDTDNLTLPNAFQQKGYSPDDFRAAVRAAQEAPGMVDFLWYGGYDWVAVAPDGAGGWQEFDWSQGAVDSLGGWGYNDGYSWQQAPQEGSWWNGPSGSSGGSAGASDQGSSVPAEGGVIRAVVSQEAKDAANRAANDPSLPDGEADEICSWCTGAAGRLVDPVEGEFLDFAATYFDLDFYSRRFARSYARWMRATGYR